jgi:hypothetical protein
MGWIARRFMFSERCSTVSIQKESWHEHWNIKISENKTLFFFGATAPIWALAYLHETLHFTSVF